MYKIIYFAIVCAVVLVTSACSDRGEEVSTPLFEVTTNQSEYTVGSYVAFHFTGSPDMLTFYSGELGRRYACAGRTSAEGTPVLSFNSSVANGIQNESISLMVSQDYAGTGLNDSTITVRNIAAATWVDITDKVIWATSSANKGSGNVDLSVFKNHPVFIAFRYKGYAGSVQNKWVISSLTLRNNLSDGTSYIIANQTNAAITNYNISNITYSPGWVGRNVKNKYKWGVSNNDFSIIGETKANVATDAEAWCLSGPIDLTRVTPDFGAGFKSQSAPLADYAYRYTTAGDFTVTFVGNSSNVYGREQVVKQVHITVK